jgi:hypothetical protein
VKISELIIRDDKLDVRNDQVISSEVAEHRNAWKNSENVDPVSQPQFFRDEGMGGLGKLLILNYNYYICILLINTNSLIYIYYIIYCE